LCTQCRAPVAATGTASYADVLHRPVFVPNCKHGPFCSRCRSSISSRVLPSCVCRALVDTWRETPWPRPPEAAPATPVDALMSGPELAPIAPEAVVEDPLRVLERCFDAPVTAAICGFIGPAPCPAAPAGAANGELRRPAPPSASEHPTASGASAAAPAEPKSSTALPVTESIHSVEPAGPDADSSKPPVADMEASPSAADLCPPAGAADAAPPAAASWPAALPVASPASSLTSPSALQPSFPIRGAGGFSATLAAAAAERHAAAAAQVRPQVPQLFKRARGSAGDEERPKARLRADSAAEGASGEQAAGAGAGRRAAASTRKRRITVGASDGEDDSDD